MPATVDNLGINLDKIVDNLGEKCQDPTVKTDIITNMFYETDLSDRMEILDNVIDEVPIVNAEFNANPKPMPDANNITYDEDLVAFDNRLLKTRAIVLPFKLVPRNLLNNYVTLINKEAYKAKSSMADPFYMPFEDWFLQNVRKAAIAKLNETCIFRGIYNPAGTTTADNFDGFLKKVSDAVTAGDITPVATGAITASNVLKALQDVYDALGEQHKGGMVNIHVNPTIFDWLSRQYPSLSNRSLIISDVASAALRQPLKSIPLDGTNAIVHREVGMGNSQRVICTTKGNLHLGYYGDPNYVQIEVQKFDLQLKFIMTFKAGVEFAILKDSFGNITVNEQI